MQIQHKHVLITGAGSGLGAATASVLADAGARVALLDMNADALEAKARTLPGEPLQLVADITDETAVKHALATIEHTFGGLHGLVNCAGVVGGERILGRTGPHGLEGFSRIVGINLIGSFNMLRLSAELMSRGEADAEGERGVIINTASIAAYDGQVGQAAYAASKGAIASLTLPAARELARHGIRVMTIAPGIFETPMMAGMTPEVREALAADVPFPKRLGRDSEYAALVRHIFENSMLNGEVIRLDGALRMAAK
ncbi:SDR family NAD(P)-dependent oxidoreductase [Pseudomonas matsuisoli]|uniref:3-hydroxyacyl-CoA dehydrogenase n=1 Tax=Pseudomonas matsuisoli TaxID=1515666 RepID=A0A917Q2V6_9PSED|nr:SDR family NAD(P)-dependent oxidoreductase [Pseudomonas matsuisoli]GGK09070.1 3-hydroxyacyl-CoA dehydrogenase [Pseudomonas matsuisoli]